MTLQHFSDQMALLRILDAAANRTREGLRVIEDWVRFALDDAHLTGCLKQIRHDLAAALAVYSVGPTTGRPGNSGRRRDRHYHPFGA